MNKRSVGPKRECYWGSEKCFPVGTPEMGLWLCQQPLAQTGGKEVSQQRGAIAGSASHTGPLQIQSRLPSCGSWLGSEIAF